MARKAGGGGIQKARRTSVTDDTQLSKEGDGIEKSNI